MTDTITLRGTVGTPPRHLLTSSGLSITSFRLATTQRRYDKSQDKWVDADTNWYTVSTFRQLAENIVTSLRVGDSVVVTGRLRLREWTNADKSGLNADIEADSVGHDLSWGTAVWSRTGPGAASGTPATPASRPETGGSAWAGSPEEPASGVAGDITASSRDQAEWAPTAEAEDRVPTPF